MNNINLKLPDFPFCIFPKGNLEEYIKYTDDFDYWTRIKVISEWEILDRKNFKKEDDIPRDRFWVKKCEKCKYKWKCWWPSIDYEKLFWLDEINSIIK